ncbi:MAG: hypothetical protein IKJ06_04720 [Clostridia bacterium]|nr:hypothetical protein [Clostridia bacterium]
MKKSATKILVAVLCLSMVLGTSISAMAAVTVTGTDVKVNYFDKSVEKIKTTVRTTAAEEVTYMVHNAESLSSVEAENIKYIDQQEINGVGTFEYTLSNYNSDTDKIYVGGQSLDAPVNSTPSIYDCGFDVKVNDVALDTYLNIEPGYVKVILDSAAGVTSVKITGTTEYDVDFMKGNGYIHIFKPATLDAWTEGCTIEITTEDAVAASDVKLGLVSLTDTRLIAYAKVIGSDFEECGIKVNDEEFAAYGVSVEGAFAVELIAEDGGLETEFAVAAVKAYVDEIESAVKILE